MLLLAAGRIKFVKVCNYNYNIQVFLVLKLFKNIQIHIIQVYSSTYYSSSSCIQKYLSISVTYPVHVHLKFIHNTLSISKSLYNSCHKSFM